MNQLTLVTSEGKHELIVESKETLVNIARQHRIKWGYLCERGLCAQCRTKVVEGRECLNDITREEKLRLKKSEREEGYRLGCQIRLVQPGRVHLLHRPY